MSSFSVTKYIGPAAIVVFVLAVIAAAFAVMMPFLAAIVWGAIVAIATWKPFAWLRDRIFRGHASAAAVSVVFILIIVILVPFSVGVYGAYQKVADFSYSIMHSEEISQNAEESTTPGISLSQVLNSDVPQVFKVRALSDGAAAEEAASGGENSGGGAGILSDAVNGGAIFDGETEKPSSAASDDDAETAENAGGEPGKSVREEKQPAGKDASTADETLDREPESVKDAAGGSAEPDKEDKAVKADEKDAKDEKEAGKPGKDGKNEGILSRFKFKLPNLPESIAKLPVVGPVIAKGWSGLQQNKLDIKGIVVGAVAKIPQAAGVLVSIGKSFGSGAIMFALSLFFIGYFYVEGPMYADLIYSLVRRVGGDKGKIYLNQCIRSIKSVVYGLVGASIGQGLTAFIGLYATGVHNAVVLSIIAAIFSVVPCAPLTVGLWGCYQLYSYGETAYAIMLLFWFCFVVCTIDSVIKLIAIKRYGGTSMSTFLILISVFGGAMAFGLLGVFLGPVVLSLFHSMVDTYAGVDGNAGAAALRISGPSSGSGAGSPDQEKDHTGRDAGEGNDEQEAAGSDSAENAEGSEDQQSAPDSDESPKEDGKP